MSRFWTYYPHPIHDVAFYAETQKMTVTEFVEVINRKYRLHATTSYVGTSNTPPQINFQGKLYHITNKMAALDDAMDRIPQKPELLKELSHRLEKNTNASAILDLFIETASEFGIELEKEALLELQTAEADAESLGGAVIVYGNYLIIS